MARKSFYTTHATKKFRETLQEYQEQEADRLSLESEIDVARTLAERAIFCFDQTHFGEKEASFSDEIKATARAAVQRALENVSSLIERHAKVAALSKGTFNPEQVDQIFMQILRIIDRHVVDPKEQDLIRREIEGIRTTSKSEGKTIQIAIA